MATPPESVRAELAGITAATSAELTHLASQAAVEQQAAVLLDGLSLIVPAYYDAAAILAVAWYDELRGEASPSSLYVPSIIGTPETDWIDREAKELLRALNDDDLAAEMQRMTDEITRLAEKEVARGFRASITGNTRQDADAIGWSRVAREGACKFCLMLADKGAVYRSESSAIFAAHKSCNCTARPEFVGGEHGPEASVIQYEASSRRSDSEAIQAAPRTTPTLRGDESTQP